MTADASERGLVLRVPAVRDNVPVVRREVCELASRAGFESRAEDIQLTITEACANAVVHAYVERPGELARLFAAEPDAGVLVF